MLELSQCFLVSFTADVEALRVKLIAQGESEEEVESKLSDWYFMKSHPEVRRDQYKEPKLR